MASSCRREMDVQSVMETVSTSCCKNNNIQWRTYRYPYAPEDLAEELLKELANQSEAGGDTAGFVSTQEHFLAAPRNMRGLQDSSLIQNAQCDTKSRN